jgi:hypothetical protein
MLSYQRVHQLYKVKKSLFFIPTATFYYLPLGQEVMAKLGTRKAVSAVPNASEVFSREP